MPSPIEEIKSRLSIQDVVGSYIRLLKAGANFKALCPFHNEKTPSFYVSPAREIWHCFGCNSGGDAFRFVQQMEGVEFPEALEILAQRAGVILKRQDPRLLTERKRMFTLLEEASSYFEMQLEKQERVASYLKSRGLSGETCRSFRLGYAPNEWRSLLSFLNARGYQREEMERSGLAVRNEKGDFYDRFRGRIMFPIADGAGRLVGFSGRIFEAAPGTASEEQGGKYINTPQTILYDKSRVLYLWDRAKNEIRKENACVLVEGQMDALMSHQAGVVNTVATSGTALGREHLSTIKRLCSRLLLAFDTDEAGEEAARRGVEAALQAGFEVGIIPILHGKDPADMIREDPETWREVTRNARPFLEVLIKRLCERFSRDPLRLRREMSREILPYVVLVENELEKAHWVQEISKVLALREEVIWEELKRISRLEKRPDAENEKTGEGRATGRTRRDLLEERIIGLLAFKGGELRDAGVEVGEAGKFFSESRKPFIEYLTGEKEAFLPEELRERVEKFAFEAELLYPEARAAGEEFQTLFLELEREWVRERLEKLASEIRGFETRGESEKLSASLEEFKSLSHKLAR